MTTQKLLYQIALTLVKGIGNITAKQVIEHLGDAEILFKEKKRILEKIPGISPRIVTEIFKSEVLQRAEKEISFIEKNKIDALFITDEAYPRRFKECVDAPVILYFKGKTDLNASHVISIVGTRHATAYGREMSEQLIHDFSKKIQGALIVSGLAYGIDIAAHKAALREKLPTVGVLAHGLDRLYPPQHRTTAIEMLEEGGLLTDFISETNPDRQNFVKRNRIIAGIADCTLVIESASKGGALITATIADSYNRDVFAVPGKVNDVYSQGCNKLIKENKAALIEKSDDLLREMCWMQVSGEQSRQAIQRTILLELSVEQQLVVDVLSKTNGIQINLLAIELNLPISKLSVILFELEMEGIVRAMPGGMHRLV